MESQLPADLKPQASYCWLTQTFRPFFNEEKRLEVSAVWAGGLLFVVLVGRLYATYRLYGLGFNSISADEFGRMIDAANWAKQPYALWYGPWLPFHSYFFGMILRFHWDLLWLPRIVMILIGTINLITAYLITKVLFRNRLAAVVAAAALSLNPAHLWLSSTPLTEQLTHSIVMLALLCLILYLQKYKSVWAALSGLLFAIGNGFRFESWVFTALFSVILVLFTFKRVLKKEQTTRASIIPLAAACLPWAFPIMWLLGNHIFTGDAFFFLNFVRDYKQTHYGLSKIPTVYSDLFSRLDPFIYRLGGYGVLFSVILRRFRWDKIAYLLAAILPASALMWMAGGQNEPMGNYIRYFGPFLFYLYPYFGILLVGVVSCVSFPKWCKHTLLGASLLLISCYQAKNTANYYIDPAAQGVEVGLRVKQFLDENQSEHPSAIIQREYWSYLAIQTAANDDGFLTFDPAMDKQTRDSNSLLLSDPGKWETCVLELRPGLLVYKDKTLQEVLKERYGLLPFYEVNGYQFYSIPDDPTLLFDAWTGETCPLRPDLPFDIFEAN